MGPHNLQRPNFWMARAVHRGRTLLQSPVAFHPSPVQSFQFTTCFWSTFAGFTAATVCFFIWIFFTGVIYMLRRHFVLRPSQILTPNCNFILTGSGIATILRQQILEFLYTAGDRSIQCLCHCSTAVFCASVNWIQVDTPSVADDIESDEH